MRRLAMDILWWPSSVIIPLMAACAILSLLHSCLEDIQLTAALLHAHCVCSSELRYQACRPAMAWQTRASWMTAHGSSCWDRMQSRRYFCCHQTPPLTACGVACPSYLGKPFVRGQLHCHQHGVLAESPSCQVLPVAWSLCVYEPCITVL